MIGSNRKESTLTLSDSILPEFDQEMGNTRKLIERCPDDKFGWGPHEKSYKLGELVSHLVNLPTWTMATINEDAFDMAPEGGDAPRAKEFTSAGAALEAFENNVAAARKAVAGASNENLLGNWTLRSGGHDVFTMPRIAVLRSFVMNHQIHHRGQLTVYLRLLDIPLPAIYGPTADENPGM